MGLLKLLGLNLFFVNFPLLPSPPLILCDHISATYLNANPILYAQTEHVEIDYHFVREHVLQRSLSLVHTF